MKNVAIIVTSLNSGGAERIAGLLSKELSKYYNVYLFLLNTENIIYEYGGTIVNIGQSASFYEYSIKYNKKKYNIDVAISFLEIMNFANIRTRGREKVIISERSVQSLIEPPLISETLKIKRFYNFADQIVTCSEGVKYDLTYNYGINNNVTTIYNFINKERIINKALDKLPNNIESFLGGADFFVNIGRLHPQKNQKRLIQQFAIFHENDNEKIKLIILGSGFLEKELTDYIKELNLEEFIKIVPYTNNPFVYIAKAKALIVSSHYEGLPNVILEAMTLRCPIIATDCLAGPRELLKSEADYGKKLKPLEVCDRGILVVDDLKEDDGTTCYMAEAMKIVVSNQELVRQMVYEQLKYMEQYKNENIINHWIEVIENEEQSCSDVLAIEDKILNDAAKIGIYGAGYVGKSCYLRLRSKYKIDFFVVSDLKNQKQNYMNVPIKSISEIENIEDVTFIIGVGDVYQDEVLRELYKRNVKKIVFPYIEPLSFEYYINESELDIKKELEDWYRLYAEKEINLDNPVTYNEKIQWLKLYDNIPIKTKLADKYAVREYVKEKIGEEYLIPILGVWNTYDDIDFTKLPDKFALKCNHASGTNILVNDKSVLEHVEMKETFDAWMKVRYEYMSGFEMHYAGILPKILAEEMLESEDGEDLKDYKVFVFDGKVKLIQVDIDRHHEHRRNLYTPDWEYIPCSILYPTAPDVVIERPACLEKLICLSEKLGEGFIHVRVDFYICKNQIYFGEMTFTHGSGTERFVPEEYGLEMGAWMKLPKGEI